MSEKISPDDYSNYFQHIEQLLKKGKNRVEMIQDLGISKEQYHNIIREFKIAYGIDPSTYYFKLELYSSTMLPYQRRVFDILLQKVPDIYKLIHKYRGRFSRLRAKLNRYEKALVALRFEGYPTTKIAELIEKNEQFVNKYLKRISEKAGIDISKSVHSKVLERRSSETKKLTLEAWINNFPELNLQQRIQDLSPIDLPDFVDDKKLAFSKLTKVSKALYVLLNLGIDYKQIAECGYISVENLEKYHINILKEQLKVPKELRTYQDWIPYYSSLNEQEQSVYDMYEFLGWNIGLQVAVDSFGLRDHKAVSKIIERIQRKNRIKNIKISDGRLPPKSVRKFYLAIKFHNQIDTSNINDLIKYAFYNKELDIHYSFKNPYHISRFLNSVAHYIGIDEENSEYLKCRSNIEKYKFLSREIKSRALVGFREH